MGECEPRIEVIVKMQTKSWGRGVGVRSGGSIGGCEPRIAVIVKKKVGGSGGWM